MFTELFEDLGLSKNEAEIYEVLLKYGESSVAEISTRSKIHRRNVYDTLSRLQDRGLVFEIRLKREARYQPVDPDRLLGLLDEKRGALSKALPQLKKWYRSDEREQAVFIYRGIEGWKNYMRDILRVGKDYYCIAGKGGWMDPRLEQFFPWFIKELERKRLKCYVLFDHEVKANNHPVTKHVGPHYRFFPKEYSTNASIEVFGDRVNLVTNIHFGGLEEDFSFTVIVNPQLADAFRTWFNFMWLSCKAPPTARGGSKHSYAP